MNSAILISQVLLWIVMAGVIVVMAAMLRQLGVLFERVAPAGALAMNSKIEKGASAPTFSLSALGGRSVSIGQSDDDRNTLLFFFSTRCPVCDELLPALRSFNATESNELQTLYIGSAQEQGHAAFASEKNIPLNDIVVSDEVGMAFAVAKLPYAVLLDPRGRISAFGLVNNREHLESLLEARRENVASIQEYMQRAG